MIYQQLFSQVKEPAVVRAALIGCGNFGTAIVTQAKHIPRLELKVICDTNIEAARNAYRLAGIPDADVAVCDTAARALWAMEAGKWVIVEDAMNLMSLPLHVIVTATMVPEAGVTYAYEAIRHGKHVVMVDKEADSVCGPILKHFADKAGVVYTAEDGDQPSLIMGLMSWANMLGLETLGGGYMHESEYDPKTGRLNARWGKFEMTVPEEDRWALDRIPQGQEARYMEVRDRLAKNWEASDACPADMCHLVVTANGTGLMPEVPLSHRQIVRIQELPNVLSPQSEGGMCRTRNTLSLPNILLTGETPYADCGVFLLVTSADAYAREIMACKRVQANWNKTIFLVYRLYHMCGVETATSIMVAGLLRAPTGGTTVLPRLDVTVKTTRSFKKGETVSRPGQLAYDPDMWASLIPATPLADDNPLPAYMVEANSLAVDVPKGTTITRSMVVPPKESVMWFLRQKQDELFLSAKVAK
jgi:predicted homoserine dehydrogenase-like protein